MKEALSRSLRSGFGGAVGLAVLLLAASPAVIQGSETGIVAFTLSPFDDGSVKNFYTAGSASVDYSAGFKFHAADPIKLTHLGTLDWNSVTVGLSGDGLDVAMYTTNGTLIASATVTTSDTLTSYAGIDGRDGTTNSVFRYHQLGSPVNIAPGDYVIISETVRGDVIPKSFGTFGFSYGGGGYITPGSGLGVSWLQQWTRGGISSAAFFGPPDPDPTAGYFGPNFLAIPEPTALALAGAGAVLLWRRRSG